MSWLLRLLRRIAALFGPPGTSPTARSRVALVATLNVHSGLPNPIWRVPEADWPELQRRIHAPALPRLIGDNPFTLGCVIVESFGPAVGLPDRLVSGPDVMLVEESGTESHRRDVHGLYRWLLDSAASAGLSEIVRSLRP